MPVPYCVLTGFCTFRTLYFSSFLSSAHLRTVTFLHFLVKDVRTGGPVPREQPNSETGGYSSSGLPNWEC